MARIAYHQARTLPGTPSSLLFSNVVATLMRGRLAALRHLAVDALPVWVLLGGVVLAGGLAYIAARDRSLALGVLYAGTWLQVFGLAFIAIGLRELRQQFEGKPVHHRVRGWFRRFFQTVRPGPPQTIEAKGAMLAGSVLFSGTVTADLTHGPGASDQRRIEMLEENLLRLRADMDARFEKQRAKITALEQAMTTERDDRQALSRAMNDTVKKMAVGRFDYEVVGLIWLAFGMIASCIPDEVVWVFRLF